MRAMPHRLVFIDETSTTTKLTRLRGRAPVGERLPGAVPFGHWLSQTFIAGLRCNGLPMPPSNACQPSRNADVGCSRSIPPQAR